ncbi:MAG: glycosyltransferase [Bacteroidia bacterium]|nr:glycosyltransferase [Bacteroidia bacterium]
MNILSQLIGTLYVVIMLYFGMGFIKGLRRSISKKSLTQNFQDFTIIIPFRNEGETLRALVRSLDVLKQPKDSNVKFIFSNDHSEDHSLTVLQDTLAQFPFEYEIILSAGDGKKAALQTAIHHVNTDWIVTTDADVEVPQTWLLEIEKAIAQTHGQMIVMPIELSTDGSFFQDLQKLESAALVAMNAGALMMGNMFSANGANLAFTKTVFNKVGGYAPEMNVASGDDEFLLKRVHHFDKSLIDVYFTSESKVVAQPCHTFKELINQRTRWVSKTKINKLDIKQFPVIIPTFFMLYFIVSIPVFLFTGYSLHSTGLLFHKWIGDLIIYGFMASFFSLSLRKNPQVVLLILAMPFYQIAYMAPVVYKRFFGQFAWKGRKYHA